MTKIWKLECIRNFETFLSALTVTISSFFRAMCYIDFSMPIDAVVQDKDKITNLEISLDKFGTNKPAKLNLERKRRRKNINIDEGSRQCKNFDFYAFEHPVLFVNHLSEGSLFILDKKWMDVVKTFDAPVHKHVYGT